MSRNSFLKGLLADGIQPPSLGRLSEACMLIDRLEREGAEPTVMVPRKPVAGSWLVPGWMRLGATTILYGPGGTGKSLLALYFAVCAVSGRPCGRWPIAPVNRVLYLDWEEDSAVPHEERLHGILGPAGFPDPGERLMHRTMAQPLSDGIERLRVLVDRHGIDLVIVDSLHAASGGEVEGAEAAIRTLTALRSLSRCSRLVIGHVTAMGAEQTDGIPKLYGSVFNTNLARATIYLAEETVRPDEKILTAHLKKVNQGAPQKPVGFQVVFNDDPDATDVWIRDHAPDLSRGPLGERILAFLKGGRECITAIAENLGVDTAKVRTTLHRLKEHNKVVSLPITGGDKRRKVEWGLVDTRHNT